MKQFIRTVTITGIDEFTSRPALLELQKRFPFVEWGVLLSQNKAGNHNRYPSLSWVDELSYWSREGLVLSGHLCGSWANKVVEGQPQLVEVGILNLFRRVQLNISQLVGSDKLSDLATGLRLLLVITAARPIIQVKHSSPWGELLQPLFNDIDILFDCSGGRGVLPTSWPSPAYNGVNLGNCGFAGGLSPANLAEQLPLMAAAAGDQPVWIDVESGVRTNEVLDLVKVQQFLTIAEPWVINGSNNANDRQVNQADSVGGTIAPTTA